jgi:hypothetical protein
MSIRSFSFFRQVASMTKNGKFKTKIVRAMATASKKTNRRSAEKQQKHNKTNWKSEKLTFNLIWHGACLNPA